MYELDKEAFGRFVAQARKARGLTQRQLAGQLHVTDKAVSKWERGRGAVSRPPDGVPFGGPARHDDPGGCLRRVFLAAGAGPAA